MTTFLIGLAAIAVLLLAAAVYDRHSEVCHFVAGWITIVVLGLCAIAATVLCAIGLPYTVGWAVRSALGV